MNALPIGAKVTIRESSQFFGTNADINPAGKVGVVVENRQDDLYLPYRVKWLHSGGFNSYGRKDLRYWRGLLPDYARGVHHQEPEKPKAEKPKPVEGKLSKETIQRAIKSMDREDHQCTARYAFLHADGYEVNTNTACHATVLVYQGDKRADTLGILTSIKNRRKNGKPWSSTYYEWLFNRSPWASVFAWKDVEYCQRVGYVLVRTDVPDNLMQGALIATRQPWEHGSVIKTFDTLVEHGVEGNLAFYLASCFRAERGYVTASMHSAGHFPLDVYSMGQEGIKAFVEGKPLKEGPIYRDSTEYVKHVHAAFTSKGSCLNAKRILERCKPEVKKTQGNPFVKAKPKPGNSVTTPIEAFVAYVKEHPIYE